ncbi:hypothetical protein [Klebsiella quasipneumoniae]|uniref:hypothetical protein n=1 Tax=Klebsiella quasipneumoniae TaxID=1463165 RepID=UPI0021D4E4E0|nr:hypothetical protein [Klebsiella quasipneumoniae]
MTDITELAHGNSLRKKLNRRLNDAYGFQRTSGGKHTTISLSIAECKSVIAALDERLALVESLEKAQRANAAQDDHINQQQDRIDQLEKGHQEAAKQINSWRRMAKQNIAEREKDIAELDAARQRIAELESRTVKLPKPHAHLIWIQAGHAPDDYWDDVAVSHSEKDHCCDGSERYPVYARWEIEEMLTGAGIKVEAE